MGARNRVGIGLSYRHAGDCICKLYGAHESIPPAYVAFGAVRQPFPTRFLAPLDCSKIPAQATIAGGIDSLESIPMLLKRYKYRVAC
jgi:hypothetical protein